MAVSVAVCEIFSVKEWCDLENGVRVRSRSLKLAPFDRSHTSSSFHPLSGNSLNTLSAPNPFNQCKLLIKILSSSMKTHFFQFCLQINRLLSLVIVLYSTVCSNVSK